MKQDLGLKCKKDGSSRTREGIQRLSPSRSCLQRGLVEWLSMQKQIEDFHNSEKEKEEGQTDEYLSENVETEREAQ